MAVCRRCHDDVPGYYLGSTGVCVECGLNARIPPGHQIRENYSFVSAYGHQVATARPKTGNQLLDGTPSRPGDAGIWGGRYQLGGWEYLDISIGCFLLWGLACHQIWNGDRVIAPISEGALQGP